MVTFRNNNNKKTFFRSNNNRRPSFRRNDEGSKFKPNFSMALDCTVRIEQSIIQESIDNLREKLKDVDDNEELDIINQLSNLEQNIFKVKEKYNEE